MTPKHMLATLAARYQHHGPMRRCQDAALILQMLDSFDEETARVYMDNFVRKWNLLEDPTRAPSSIRRRPMSELEQRVYASLLASPGPSAQASLEPPHHEPHQAPHQAPHQNPHQELGQASRGERHEPLQE